MRSYFWNSVLRFKTQRAWHILFLASCLLFLGSFAAGAVYRMTSGAESVFIHFSALGNAFAARGQIGEALESYSELLEIRPNPDVEFNMANTLATTGKTGEAIRHYRRALRLNPGFAEAHFNLANLLAGEGDLKAAFEHYRLATAIRPGYVDAWFNWGVWLWRSGQDEEALTRLSRVSQLQPEHADAALTRGLILLRDRRWREARGVLEEGLRRSPEHLNLADTLAWTLATSPSEEVRDGPQAVGLAEKVCAASGRANAQYLDTLAAAYAETGRFAPAIEAAQQALRLASDSSNDSLASALRTRLKLYREGRPYRAG